MSKSNEILEIDVLTVMFIVGINYMWAYIILAVLET